MFIVCKCFQLLIAFSLLKWKLIPWLPRRHVTRTRKLTTFSEDTKVLKTFRFRLENKEEKLERGTSSLSV